MIAVMIAIEVFAPVLWVEPTLASAELSLICVDLFFLAAGGVLP